MSPLENGTPMLRTMSWVEDAGSDKQLVAAILTGKLDEVRIPATTPASVSRLLAMGFPTRLEDGDGLSHTLTLVLQPRLSWSQQDPVVCSFVATCADIEAFGRASGDLNPLHFDDTFAQRAGFRRRIAHGMLFNSWLTRVLGTELPGPGSIISQTRSLFLAPIYPDEVCNVRLSVGSFDPDRGRYQMVAQLLDPDGRHCVLSYTDVVRRPAAQ
jgi:acyl dehydratase